MYKTKTNKITAVFAALSLGLSSCMWHMAQADAPTIINYQSQFVKPSGVVEDRAIDLRFSLWSDADLVGGDITGTGDIDTGAATYADFEVEFWNVTPDSEGVVNIPVGATTPLPILDPDIHQYMQVEIRLNADNGDDTAYEVLDPDTSATVDRRALNSVPYSFYSDFVGKGTKEETLYIDADNDAADLIGIDFGGAALFDYSKTNSRFRFNRDVNFQKNQAVNMVLHTATGSSQIDTPDEGQIYYNSTSKDIEYYDGTSWNTVGAGAASSGTGELTSVTFHAEWPSVFYKDGSNNNGVFVSSTGEASDDNASCGLLDEPTDLRTYYCWAATTGSPQDFSLRTNYTLPDDFKAFDSTKNLTVTYRTESGNDADNSLDVAVSSGSTAITLFGDTNLHSNNTWEQESFVFTGSINDFDPGDMLTIDFTFNSDSGWPVRVSDFTIHYLREN